MTREEVIEMLSDDIKNHHDYLSGQYRKGLEIEIAALEQAGTCEGCKHFGKWGRMRLNTDIRLRAQVAKEGQWIVMKDDTISRQDAIKTAHLPTIEDAGYEVIRLDDILKLPSIQSEIIRCKDCKHWIPYDWMFSEVWQSKNIADYPEDEIGCDCCDMAMKSNDFCSRAERGKMPC